MGSACLFVVAFNALWWRYRKLEEVQEAIHTNRSALYGHLTSGHAVSSRVYVRVTPTVTKYLCPIAIRY
jgi:hypothetical protein